MGERGPAPVPKKLAQLHGDPGKKRKTGTLRTAEVGDNDDDRKKLLTPPSYLDKYAKAEWRRLAPKLVDTGMLTTADTAAFAAYCHSYGVFVTASRAVKARENDGDPPLTFETDKGYEMQIPEISIAASAKKQMLSFAKEFGLTPASRITADDAEKDDGASIMDFIRNKKQA